MLDNLLHDLLHKGLLYDCSLGSRRLPLPTREFFHRSLFIQFTYKNSVLYFDIVRARFRVTSSVHLRCIPERDLRNLVPFPDYLRSVCYRITVRIFKFLTFFNLILLFLTVYFVLQKIFDLFYLSKISTEFSKVICRVSNIEVL